MAYYRTGSAASAMSTDTVDLAAVRAARVLHLSGITAALSGSCLDLLWELTEPGPQRPFVSFDINYRPGLWPDPDGPRVLLDLARRADIVFVGSDEAVDAWGLHGASAVRDALPEPELVVVKMGPGGAVAFDQDPGDAEDADGTATLARAPRVDVVAEVGAGDAFAAGFLSATLRALPVRDRLRHGHLMAAAALTVPGDLATPPAREHADRLVALDDTAWGRLRLGPGWTDETQRADEEVRTS